MPNEHVSALQSMAICGALAPAELDAIAVIVETREIAAGGELFREGEPGDGLFLVISGEVDVVKNSASGERLLAHFGAGGVLGEMSLVTSDARSATGRAMVDTRVLHLPAARFRSLLGSESQAALKLVAAIAAVLARRLATMNGLVLELADKVAPASAPRSPMKTQDLAALHRTMQIWSF